MINQLPLKFISREKEWELINKLLTIVDDSEFDPEHTAVMMVSPDYSATVAMHLAHAWSRKGDMLSIVPVHVTFPDETPEAHIERFKHEFTPIASKYNKLVLVEAGIIRGGNWTWLLKSLDQFGYSRKQLTLVALCENIHSKVKSDYVGEYYDADKEDLTFYFERFNKHWPVLQSTVK